MAAEIFENIAKIVMCHAVGDYLFQSDYIAGHKGKNWYILSIHCVLYCVPFAIVFGITWKLAVLFATHFAIDALKTRYGKIGIVTDQAMHYAIACIYLV